MAIHYRSYRSGIPALLIAAGLSACQAAYTDGGRVDWLDEDQHRIVVTASDFSGAEALRVGFGDSWQVEEYALLKAGGRQMELIFAEASDGFTVALDYQMPLEMMVATWNQNARTNIAWGPLGRYDWRPGTWFYRIFWPDRRQRVCVGLLVEWDEIYEDFYQRPRRVLFGYACRGAGESFEDEDVRALIRGIGIRPRETGSRWRAWNRRASAQAQTPSASPSSAKAPPAIVAAKGEGRFAGNGNPNFPFAFARFFSDNNGGSRR